METIKKGRISGKLLHQYVVTQFCPPRLTVDSLLQLSKKGNSAILLQLLYMSVLDFKLSYNN